MRAINQRHAEAMRLKTVATPPHFIVKCFKCGRQVNTANEPLLADLDGEAFKAYYCTRCAPDAAEGKER